MVVDKADILGFIDLLAAFIKWKQTKSRRIENITNNQYEKVDTSCIKKYFIQVYDSIYIWKTKINNSKEVQYEH